MPARRSNGQLAWNRTSHTCTALSFLLGTMILDNLFATKATFSITLRSEKFAASVKADVDEKKHATEAIKKCSKWDFLDRSIYNLSIYPATCGGKARTAAKGLGPWQGASVVVSVCVWGWKCDCMCGCAVFTQHLLVLVLVCISVVIVWIPCCRCYLSKSETWMLLAKSLKLPVSL